MKFKEKSKRKQFILYCIRVPKAQSMIIIIITVCALGIYTQTSMTSEIVSVIVAKNRKCGDRLLFIAVYGSHDPISVYLADIT